MNDKELEIEYLEKALEIVDDILKNIETCDASTISAIYYLKGYIEGNIQAKRKSR